MRHIFTHKHRKSGFTLIELIVSLAVFLVVVVIITGSILSVLDVYTKVQNRKIAMDNLNFALESMARTIRFGTNFHCGTTAPLTSPQNCTDGDTSLTVTAGDGSVVTFSTSTTATALTRTVGGNTLRLTSPEITIGSVKFYVIGANPPVLGTACASQSSPNDCLQSRVIIVVSGYVGTNSQIKTKSSFNLETTVSQRKLDI